MVIHTEIENNEEITIGRKKEKEKTEQVQTAFGKEELEVDCNLKKDIK